MQVDDDGAPRRGELESDAASVTTRMPPRDSRLRTRDFVSASNSCSSAGRDREATTMRSSEASGDRSAELRACVGGVPMRWLQSGAGPAVVLVHGIPTSPELWRHVLPRAGGARLLAWEMVGYGRSWRAGTERDISLRAQADHLDRWMEHVGVERAVLVGHDLGGGVVQILATRRRERCAGLVLVDAVAYDSWPIPSVRALRALGGVLGWTPQPAFRAVLGALLRRDHDDRARAAESVRAHWLGYGHRQGRAVFLRQIRSLRTQDTLEIAGELTRLDVPATVVWGAEDPFHKLSYGRRLASDLHAQLDAVAGARHFVPEDHPERVARAISGVLARVD